jgi:hypothetical protein
MLAASRAAAQSDEELARARELFGEGVRLLASEQWEEAADRFRQVHSVRATGAVKYNLAIAVHGLGRLAEAAQLLTEALEDDGLERRQRRHARQLLSTIEPQLGLLTITIPEGVTDATVTLDGAAIPADRIGTPFPVDPGEHQVALVRGGRSVGSSTVTVSAGATEEVALEVTAALPPVEVDTETPFDREPEPARGGDVTGEAWFWGVIIGAVLLVAGGAVAIGFAVSPQGQPEPVQGNLMPGVLQVMLP